MTMLDENELRAQLRNSTPPATAIDTAAIISGSKAMRRTRRQWAGGAFAGLAAVSLLFAAVTTFAPTDNYTAISTPTDQADTSSGSDTGLGEAKSFAAPTDPAWACGTSVADRATSPYGLQLEIDFDNEVIASGSAFGTVRLTNISTSAVTGTTASIPDVTLIRQSVVISHSPDAQILAVIPVNLQPGQSIEFAVSLDIYDCTTIDTGGMIAPGNYVVAASLAFVPADPTVGAAAEVRSAQTRINLR
ncbi:MAG: hypothetical protein ACOH1K_05930 [Rhodoglobus sp.]